MSSITGRKIIRKMEEELHKLKNVNFVFSTLNSIRGQTQLFMYFSKAVKKYLRLRPSITIAHLCYAVLFLLLCSFAISSPFLSKICTCELWQLKHIYGLLAYWHVVLHRTLTVLNWLWVRCKHTVWSLKRDLERIHLPRKVKLHDLETEVSVCSAEVFSLFSKLFGFMDCCFDLLMLP